MTIATTGAVSFSDLRTEFVGGSSAISFSDLYRGGSNSNIRTKAANNNAVNLAASVPTSGSISVTNFRGAAKGFRFTFSSGATNQNAATLFGDDYAVNYPKEIVINSGVELGATSTSEEALELPSGGVGPITVTNNGTLSGAGGAAGEDGGDAFETAVAVAVVNNGVIRAGGGGGGDGGMGSYESVNYQYQYSPYTWMIRVYGGKVEVRWAGTRYINGYIGVNTTSYGQWRRGSYVATDSTFVKYYVGQASTVYSSGGVGGVGQGYNQAAGTGASGFNNAGDGGDGGSFGQPGTDGANGNVLSGEVKGVAGNYIRGFSLLSSFSGSGSVQGGTA
tara:strand:+ start:2593 stop:3594 length:1002 start_codon:yes stop_codon:yes gene_type:complete